MYYLKLADLFDCPLNQSYVENIMKSSKMNIVSHFIFMFSVFPPQAKYVLTYIACRFMNYTNIEAKSLTVIR